MHRFRLRFAPCAAVLLVVCLARDCHCSAANGPLLPRRRCPIGTNALPHQESSEPSRSCRRPQLFCKKSSNSQQLMKKLKLLLPLLWLERGAAQPPLDALERQMGELQLTDRVLPSADLNLWARAREAGAGVGGDVAVFFGGKRGDSRGRIPNLEHTASLDDDQQHEHVSSIFRSWRTVLAEIDEAADAAGAGVPPAAVVPVPGRVDSSEASRSNKTLLRGAQLALASPAPGNGRDSTQSGTKRESDDEASATAASFLRRSTSSSSSSLPVAVHNRSDEPLVVGPCARLSQVERVVGQLDGGAQQLQEGIHGILKILPFGSERDALRELQQSAKELDDFLLDVMRRLAQDPKQGEDLLQFLLRFATQWYPNTPNMELGHSSVVVQYDESDPADPQLCMRYQVSLESPFFTPAVAAAAAVSTLWMTALSGVVCYLHRKTKTLRDIFEFEQSQRFGEARRCIQNDEHVNAMLNAAVDRLERAAALRASGMASGAGGAEVSGSGQGGSSTALDDSGNLGSSASTFYAIPFRPTDTRTSVETSFGGSFCDPGDSLTEITTVPEEEIQITTAGVQQERSSQIPSVPPQENPAHIARRSPIPPRSGQVEVIAAEQTPPNTDPPEEPLTASDTEASPRPPKWPYPLTDRSPVPAVPCNSPACNSPRNSSSDSLLTDRRAAAGDPEVRCTLQLPEMYELSEQEPEGLLHSDVGESEIVGETRPAGQQRTRTESGGLIFPRVVSRGSGDDLYHHSKKTDRSGDPSDSPATPRGGAASGGAASEGIGARPPSPVPEGRESGEEEDRRRRGERAIEGRTATSDSATSDSRGGHGSDSHSPAGDAPDRDEKPSWKFRRQTTPGGDTTKRTADSDSGGSRGSAVAKAGWKRSGRALGSPRAFEQNPDKQMKVFVPQTHRGDISKLM